MKVEILSIGNEVVYGDIVNTNAAWLSQELTAQGFQVIRHLTIADDEAYISEALLEAPKRVNAVLVTGGLGPTVDDFTLEIAGKIFGLPLEKNSEIMGQLESFYAARKRSMTPNQEKQAMIPKGGQVFVNPIGSAPGVRIEFQGVQYFFFPGVPKEMKEIFKESILPWLVAHREPPAYNRSKLLRCFGAEEARLDALIQPLLKDRVKLGNASVAFRVKFPEIFIKISAGGSSAEETDRELKQASAKIEEAVKEFLYGEEEDTLEGVVGCLLKEKNLTLALAESCTGGQIAHRITNIPGASQYFKGGVVAYSDELKVNLLGVPEDLLKKHGAVSRETALAMAEGARLRLKSDLALSVTGIAGPSGGSEEKPVGTFHIALASAAGTEEKKFYFPLDRERFKRLVSSVALNWVRKFLLRDFGGGPSQ